MEAKKIILIVIAIVVIVIVGVIAISFIEPDTSWEKYGTKAYSKNGLTFEIPANFNNSTTTKEEFIDEINAILENTSWIVTDTDENYIETTSFYDNESDTKIYLIVRNVSNDTIDSRFNALNEEKEDIDAESIEKTTFDGMDAILINYNYDNETGQGLVFFHNNYEYQLKIMGNDSEIINETIGFVKDSVKLT